jgi:hypothetical protein
LLRSFYPSFFITDWQYYLFGLVLFMIPGLLSTYKQMKSGYSLEMIELTNRPFRGL